MSGPLSGFQHRQSPRGGVEDFPTPPWATRALMEHVLLPDPRVEFDVPAIDAQVVWEPAANRGYMARPLAEYFGEVFATDVVDYGAGYRVLDFCSLYTVSGVDWVITNPPFNKAEEFIEKALVVADRGVAMLLRTNFAEGVGRYNNIFSKRPPTVIAQFAERVPIVRGRVDRRASTAMPYAWFVWYLPSGEYEGTEFLWIPPCRAELEKEGDYAEIETREDA